VNSGKEYGKKAVVGGPAFTTSSNTFKNADHYILDEAEITLPLFLKDFKQGKTKRYYRSKKRPDITKTPQPLWSLLNFKDYAAMALQYSRGCPYNCEFCDIIIMNGRIPRTKTPVQFIKELNGLYDAGWRGSVFIVDDNFIGNKVEVKKLLKIIYLWQKKRKFPFKLFTEASINLAEDIELMKLMSKANFYKVFLGLETPDIETLQACSKAQNTNIDLKEAVDTIQRHGMQVMGGFIVGFDNDTDSIFETQIKFIQKIGVVTAMVGMLNALPKTQLWHRLKEEGRLLKDTSGANTDGSINFVPKMGKDVLLQGYKELLSKIYSPKLYYKRINLFIKNYKPTVKSRLTNTEIKAFVRSIWKIGIVSRSRFLYWRMVIKTSVVKIKALPIAVELSIIGQHFEKITSDIVKV